MIVTKSEVFRYVYQSFYTAVQIAIFFPDKTNMHSYRIFKRNVLYVLIPWNDYVIQKRRGQLVIDTVLYSVYLI